MNPEPEPLETLTHPTSLNPLSQKSTKPKPTGRYVPTERKATIYTLTDALHLSASAIAERLHMDYRTVKAILDTRNDAAIMARNLLDANVVTAAAAWVKAVKVGGAKGRHEPARDLLLHRRVIEPVITQSAHASVTVILNGGETPTELGQNSVPFALELNSQSETPSEQA